MNKDYSFKDIRIDSVVSGEQGAVKLVWFCVIAPVSFFQLHINVGRAGLYIIKKILKDLFVNLSD